MFDLNNSRYVPLEYASTYRARFAVPLPEFIPSRSIGIDTAALHGLLRIGGISHLRVTGNTDQETSRSVPTIVGFTAQGEAYAGKKVEKTNVPTFTSSGDDASMNLDASVFRPAAATWKNGVIQLNINEMAERIRQEDQWKKGVHSTEAWAHHLDTALRDGVADIGVKHLTLGLSKYNLADIVLQYGLMGFFEASSGHPTLESTFFRVPFVSFLLNAKNWALYRNKDDGYRWSMFYETQFDRAMVLKILSKRTKLVKNLVKPNLPDLTHPNSGYGT